MVALLVIIYVAFVGLGLPDSLLGSAWPAMYAGLGVPIGGAGAVAMILSGGTIVSSLMSDTVIRRFGTGRVTLVSTALTAAALAGFSMAGSFAEICLWAVPLGLGAGSVDAGLNNFVALHYAARHMNWLHCFWGVGAAAGPVVMGHCLTRWGSWEAGYRTVGLAQAALAVVLLATLPLWRRAARGAGGADDRAEGQERLSLAGMTRLPGARPALAAFFCYCSLESVVGLWGGSYLVTARGVPAETAARWVALFYTGITAGRFVAGFLSVRLSNMQMVRLGQALIGAGAVTLALPYGGNTLLAGLFLVGAGCAPIYPALLHETPVAFGSRYSQAVMGMQMACAYVGNTCVPPLFGLLAARAGYGMFPGFVGGLLAAMVAAVTLARRTVRRQ